VIAYGISEYGQREVIGIDIVHTESRESWAGFLQGLVARGLHGVKLVISDAHEGLKAAIASMFAGVANWQRCRVHFIRNILAHASPHRKHQVAAAFRAILAQPTAERARALA